MKLRILIVTALAVVVFAVANYWQAHGCMVDWNDTRVVCSQRVYTGPPVWHSASELVEP